MKRLLLFFLLLSSDRLLATTYSTDGSLADVNTKIAGASPGDTVTIPSGSFTWGASGTSVSVNKAITLAGAGTASTTLQMSSSGPQYGTGIINISAAGAVVKDLTINNGLSNNGLTAMVGGGADGWRITNIVYNGSTASNPGYFIYAATYPHPLQGASTSTPATAGRRAAQSAMIGVF
jgi:hypothetical protein